ARASLLRAFGRRRAHARVPVSRRRAALSAPSPHREAVADADAPHSVLAAPPPAAPRRRPRDPPRAGGRLVPAPSRTASRRSPRAPHAALAGDEEPVQAPAATRAQSNGFGIRKLKFEMRYRLYAAILGLIFPWNTTFGSCEAPLPGSPMPNPSAP